MNKFNQKLNEENEVPMGHEETKRLDTLDMYDEKSEITAHKNWADDPYRLAKFKTLRFV